MSFLKLEMNSIFLPKKNIKYSLPSTLFGFKYMHVGGKRGEGGNWHVW